jgi:hypothetical protein
LVNQPVEQINVSIIQDKAILFRGGGLSSVQVSSAQAEVPGEARDLETGFVNEGGPNALKMFR